MLFLKSLNILDWSPLFFIPLSLIANYFKWGALLIFLTSSLSLISLSIWLSTTLEKIAAVTGPAVGGLMNAFFCNATELILALVALKEGLITLVKASITGSIINNLLLLMGSAMLFGGITYKEQKFQSSLARLNGTSLTLAVVAIALPTLVVNTTNFVDELDLHRLSLLVATVLLILYGLTLVFSLKTHRNFYQVDLANNSSEIIEDKPNLGFWLMILGLITIAIAFESEIFVDVVEPVITQLGLTPLFTGVIVLPLISDLAGLITVVRLARKNQMDLTVATAMGDSLLIALFVAPCLVFAGIGLHQEINLNFNPFEAIALGVAVTVTNLICFSGQSTWLDGTLLLATYIIVGAAFYYHPV